MSQRLSPHERWLRAQTEADFQQSITEAAEALGWLVWHDQDSRRNRAGLPDLICIHPGQRRVLWLELKRETGRVRSEQMAFLVLLQAVGQEAHLVRPSDMDLVIGLLGG